MIAYHGSQEVKDKTIEMLDEHRRLDRIVQSTYWDSTRGCHLGCLTHCENGAHKRASDLFGFDIRVVNLLEEVFEGLPEDQCESWVLDSAKAIPVGADLSKFHYHLSAWLLSADSPSAEGNASPIVAEAVKQVRELHLRAAEGEEIGPSAWSAAESAARSAAWSAAESAAWSAWSAARSAAWSAAESAAESAAWSAAWSARSAAWRKIALKSIEIFKGAPVVADLEPNSEAITETLDHLEKSTRELVVI